MSVSNDFVVYAIEQLAPLAKVTSRRMFGGVGLYAEGLFFGLIADDTLYLKVDDSNRTDYEQRGSKPFCPYPDRLEFSMSYFDVPADLLDDADELSRWARKSVAIASSIANEKARRVKKKINRAGKLTRKAK
jgi:DNA transformation protein